MEIRNLNGNLFAINRGIFIDSVAVCCIPDASTLELFYNGRSIKLGEYKFYTPEHSTSKKLEVNILGIHFYFDGYADELKSLYIGDEHCRYSPSSYGFREDAPLEVVLLEGVTQDLPLNEDSKSVVVHFLEQLCKYFFGRGFNLYDQEE